jgi:hypothetical protein
MCADATQQGCRSMTTTIGDDGTLEEMILGEMVRDAAIPMVYADPAAQLLRGSHWAQHLERTRAQERAGGDHRQVVSQ